jgi:spore maturation protein SpmA
MIVISILVAAYTGRMESIGNASFESARSAVTLALGLIGGMTLWLGIMKVAEAAGLMTVISRAISPVMRWLFPEIPRDHPAMHAIIMNMAANMLGLGSAATPMGLKAMSELDKLNPNKGTATNAMCLFLAINTSSVTLLPLGVITIRAAAGATSPGSIIIPGMMASACSTIAAVFMAKFLASRNKEIAVTGDAAKSDEKIENPIAEVEKTPPSVFGRVVAWGAIIAFFAAIPYSIITAGGFPTTFIDVVTSSSVWLIPLLMGSLLMGGYLCGVNVYEAMTDGAKEGFNTAVRIIPFLVAIFVAIGMLRASGALEMFTSFVGQYTGMFGMPAECVPHALLRPLSGVGAFGYMSEIVNNAPDSLASFVSSILQGSTDTTFYILAVYFGSVSIRRTRHALAAGLTSDVVGITAAIVFANMFFGG